MKEVGLAWAPVGRDLLDVELCLNSGQFFLWQRDSRGRFVFAIGETAVLLEPHQDGFLWATHPPGNWQAIADYFALDVPLHELYCDWTERLPHFDLYLRTAQGLRILRQEPEAALLQFVCSSCNNVPRITGMLARLAKATGSFLETPWGATCPRLPSFQEVKRLSENQLRDLGFGFRARFLNELAPLAPDRLREARSLPREDARRALMSLTGVGPKVADCVCLFGMRHDDAVPVDTHIRRHVTAYFSPELARKSLTIRAYDAIASTFRGIMGPHAGWAQQYVYVWERARRRPPGPER